MRCEGILILPPTLAPTQAQEGLRCEGIFRVSAMESELAEVKGRLQGGDDTENALKQASAPCLAALIKLYLREVPRQLWLPVSDELAALLGGTAAHGVAALGEGMRGLLPRLPRRSADLVVWVCDLMLAVTTHEADNRMGPSAIVAVLAPVLMRGAASGTAPGAAMAAPGDAAAAAAAAAAALAKARQGVQLATALLEAHRCAPLSRKPAAAPQAAVS